MNSRTYILALTLFLLMTIQAYSQNAATIPFPPDVIKIESVSRKPDKALPFDKPFVLIINMDDVETVLDVKAFKVVYRQPTKDEKKAGLRRKIRDIELINGEADFILGVQFRIDSKGRNLIVEFPELPPNFHFDFAVIKQLSGNNLKEVRKYINAIADSLILHKQIDLNTLAKTFFSFSNGIDTMIYTRQASAFLIKQITFDTAHSNGLGRIYFDNKLDSVYAQLYGYNFNQAIYFHTAIAPIYSLLAANNLDNTGIVYLNTMVNSNPQSFLNGQANIKEQLTDTVKTSDFEKRISNLDTSIVYLKAIQQRLQALVLSRPSAVSQITQFSLQIDSLTTKFKENRKLLSDITTYINSKISGDPRLRYTNWYISTNVARDLQTKSSFIFTPQVGISCLVVRSNEKNIHAIPKLTWGVNINFRSIDKLAARKYLSHPTLWHYLSLHLGLTIGDFREEEYKNLYSNTSLLVGPSYRINRSLYFTAGLSLYRQKDTNPLIDKYNVTPGAYASLLLDLDITNAVSTIRNLLFK
ncbi:hypothetical protein [Chitinophaga filiformis]|uniref:Uncharacterized protein n=1 Tax=Chitinophaga filiformis TaxID=104663 RepID=A0A1G7M0R3_CHIFI|nr:hypothetical protein [Chitinophaga filiformis]SDF55241.1 hypothetical protein SAMN04488121_102248 [Chitinophaga filiformis]